VSELTEPTTFDTHLTVVRPLKEVCWPAFIGLVLNGREEDIIELAAGTTGQTELPREAVRSFGIPVPPLDEQMRIVGRLDQLRAKTSEMVAAYDAKLQAAKNLRQSILEAAFAGEL
jgi:type I restriction enzyme S subunit